MAGEPEEATKSDPWRDLRPEAISVGFSVVFIDLFKIFSTCLGMTLDAKDLNLLQEF